VHVKPVCWRNHADAAHQQRQRHGSQCCHRRNAMQLQCKQLETDQQEQQSVQQSSTRLQNVVRWVCVVSLMA
jgi:hypothetical protein